MSTQKIKPGEPVNNAGATIVLGGKQGGISSPVTNRPSSEITGHRSGLHGSTVVRTNDVNESIVGGEFAKQRPGEYSLYGYSTKAAGLPNNGIANAGAGGPRGNHFANNNVVPELNQTGYVAITANYVVRPDDEIVGVQTAGVTVTLFDAKRVSKGTRLIIKDESGGAFASNITINGNIDGVTGNSITVDYGTFEIYSNGLEWFTI